MISVDTNVLVRAVLDDDPNDSPLAKNSLQAVAEGGSLFISSYALVEMVWVLKVKKIDRHNICEALFDLLDSPGIVIGQRSIITKALEMYRQGQADFADYLILAESTEHDAPTLLSFDKALCCEQKRACSLSGFLQRA